ncbi:MAG: hypothetical protein HY919_02905 [Elusimicrobia bacterium]|nr:hypothetical protein [Elusimicrobiota bacterium]
MPNFQSWLINGLKNMVLKFKEKKVKAEIRGEAKEEAEAGAEKNETEKEILLKTYDILKRYKINSIGDLENLLSKI